MSEATDRIENGSPQLAFGVSLLPSVQPLDTHLELVRAAEDAGLDLIGIQDHPYQPRYVDTLALIGVLLARTDRIRIFPDVANLPLRPPAVLAKPPRSICSAAAASNWAWAPAAIGRRSAPSGSHSALRGMQPTPSRRRSP
jgi:Luciferase-like monooxygenase